MIDLNNLNNLDMARFPKKTPTNPHHMTRRNADIRFAFFLASNPTRAELVQILVTRYSLSRSTAYRWIDQALSRRLIHFVPYLDCYALCTVAAHS